MSDINNHYIFRDHRKECEDNGLVSLGKTILYYGESLVSQLECKDISQKEYFDARTALERWLEPLREKASTGYKAWLRNRLQRWEKAGKSDQEHFTWMCRELERVRREFGLNAGIKQDDMKQDDMKQEDVKQEGMKQEDMKREDIKQEDMKQESL